MTVHRTQEPPAAGAMGPKPRFFASHAGCHCQEFAKRMGSGANGPSRRRLFSLLGRNLPSGEVQKFWYEPAHIDPLAQSGPGTQQADAGDHLRGHARGAALGGMVRPISAKPAEPSATRALVRSAAAMADHPAEQQGQKQPHSDVLDGLECRFQICGQLSCPDGAMNRLTRRGASLFISACGK